MDRDGLGTKPPQIPGVDELLACCTAAPVADADGFPGARTSGTQACLRGAGFAGVLLMGQPVLGRQLVVAAVGTHERRVDLTEETLARLPTGH